jgi:hypothetical protein
MNCTTLTAFTHSDRISIRIPCAMLQIHPTKNTNVIAHIIAKHTRPSFALDGVVEQHARHVPAPGKMQLSTKQATASGVRTVTSALECVFLMKSIALLSIS